MLDALQGPATTPRHQFTRDHVRELAASWVVVLCSAARLAWRELPVEQWVHGLLLMAFVAIYFAAVHAGVLGLPKEIVVGVLFALGVSLTSWSRIKIFADAAPIVAFAILCWLNCAAIELWETARQNKFLPWCCAAVALFSLGLPLAAPLSLSAIALFLLLMGQRYFSRNALRVLADAALLSPLLFLLAGQM
jgi:hypothetical protein